MQLDSGHQKKIKHSGNQLLEIMDKAHDIDKLPTYAEALHLVHFVHDSSLNFCFQSGIHNMYNAEFVDALASELEKIGEFPIVEVCAGSGKLAYHLRERGINVLATDDYSWNQIKRDEKFVEKLSHKEALEKYKPKVVIAAWIHFYDSQIGKDILNYPTVNYFINIGEEGWISAETWSIVNYKGFETPVPLKDVEKYSIERNGKHRNFASPVKLFKKKENYISRT